MSNRITRELICGRLASRSWGFRPIRLVLQKPGICIRSIYICWKAWMNLCSISRAKLCDDVSTVTEFYIGDVWRKMADVFYYYYNACLFLNSVTIFLMVIIFGRSLGKHINKGLILQSLGKSDIRFRICMYFDSAICFMWHISELPLQNQSWNTMKSTGAVLCTCDFLSPASRNNWLMFVVRNIVNFLITKVMICGILYL